MSKYMITRDDGRFLYVHSTDHGNVPVGFGRDDDETCDFMDLINLSPDEAETFADWLRTYAQEARLNRGETIVSERKVQP
jgi:hypothetical protein